MSKIINNKFDAKTLGIKKEINEEIGKLKNNRIHYTNNHNPKMTKSKEKPNIHQNQIINIKFEERNKKNVIQKRSFHTLADNNKNNRKNNYNGDSRSVSNDKKSKNSSSKENIKIRTKVIKKKNLGQVERVVIDLINNNEDNYSIKTEQSNNYSIYENNNNGNNNYLRHREKENEKSLDSIQFKNKDNNCTNSNNSINERFIAINKIEGRWLNNSISNNEINLSFIINDIDKKKREIENIINKWNKENIIKKEDKINFLKIPQKKDMKIKKEIDFNYLVNENEIKRKKTKEKIDKWNNGIKTIRGENLTFMVNNMKIKEKEIDDLLIRWNNCLKDDNKIIISFEKLKEKNIFKYSEENYLRDMLSQVNFSENNNIFYIIALENNFNEPSKLNYKVINPKNKNELESYVINFYNENKIKYNESNSNNILNEIPQLNPIIILNEEQMDKLYEKINIKNKNKDSGAGSMLDSKKENADTNFTISKQIAIDYEIVERLSNSENTKTEKFCDTKKVYKEFGQTTPIAMMSEKFLVYGVSRNIKYSIQAPQSNFNLKGKGVKISTKFDIHKLVINKFNLWIERIDKIDTFKSNFTK